MKLPTGDVGSQEHPPDLPDAKNFFSDLELKTVNSEIQNDINPLSSRPFDNWLSNPQHAILLEVKTRLELLTIQMESIGKAQDVVSHRLRKAVAIGLSTLTLVLVVIVVAVELWQLNRTEAVIDTDNQCEDIPLNFSIRYVDRQEWFARDSKTPLQKFPSLPLNAVIVDTTGSFSCSTHFYCPNAVLELQNRAIAGGQQDIPANFVLVEDGYIYEGRGWEFVGEDVPGYDSTFLEVLILGNFDITFPTCSNKSLPLLLNEGVRLGFLSPNYELFGKNQFVDTLTMNTDSPLVKDMKNWSRWVPGRFNGTF